MDDSDELMRQQLRANALQPEDAEFTRRVLAALPQPRLADTTRRSFADTTRFGVVLVLLAVAQHWYRTGPGGVEAMVAVLLFLAPAFLAATLVCGPLIPRSFLRFVGRRGREWR
jgi:hypothetical protein